MKTLDQVEYDSNLLLNVKSLPVIKENFNNIVKDFERTYKAVLINEIPDEVPDEHLSKTKTDLLCAYCYGAFVSCDMKSNFRMNFKLPIEELTKLQTPKKPSIIV